MEDNKEAVLKLTFAVEALTQTMREFKEDFKKFRDFDIKEIHNDIQMLKDWRTQQTGVLNFLKLMWYFVGAIVVFFVTYKLGWKK